MPQNLFNQLLQKEFDGTTFWTGNAPPLPELKVKEELRRLPAASSKPGTAAGGTASAAEPRGDVTPRLGQQLGDAGLLLRISSSICVCAAHRAAGCACL